MSCDAIDCDRAARRLWAFLDGELPAGEVAEMERHLIECMKCQLVMEEQRWFLAALRDMDCADDPAIEALRARVRAVLNRG